MASAQSQSSEFHTGIPSQKLWGQSKPKRPTSSSSVREEEKLRFCYGSGSVSTLVSLFAAAFATQNTSQMFAPRRRYSAAKATVSRVTDARNGEERILRASVCELHAARITSPTSSRRSTSRICSLRSRTVPLLRSLGVPADTLLAAGRAACHQPWALKRRASAEVFDLSRFGRRGRGWV